MKVKQLIKKLQKLNPEAIVLISKDMEGNQHGKLYSIEANVGYNPISEDGVGLYKLTPKLKKEGFTEEDVCEGGVEAICLYPNM